MYWSKPADAKFQFTPPNASTYYAYFNYQRDLVALRQLHSIGVQKGRPFTPDQATRDVLACR